ncbi:MAG TPA: LPXTG cell wall anchor domain-containing protein, partial [Atopostipes sp.]|nr:LPXTG cell wall anchor domain-containing protein [Atopostipes sp.]
VLPEGEYTITLDTPSGTVAEINDTVATQAAEATDETNVFTVMVNEENRGSLSAVYAAFRLVEVPEEVSTYQLGVEVRGLDNRRTGDVDVTVTNDDGDVFEGSYNQYLQWLTDDELPEGEYTITLDTPAGTVAEINDSTNQYAVATDEENVFTIVLNDENLGYGSSIYGAFRLVEVPEEVETHRLGVEVRDLDNLRTDEVEIVVTNADGDVFEGSFNEYLQWLTEDELPVGVYTITLTTPEGTVAEINDTVATQAAEATDEDNVFTILVNEENRGSLSAVYGAFRLVEVDEEEQDNDDENGETPPVDEEDSNDDNGDTPDDDVEDDVDEDDVEDEDDEDVVVISDELPLTGIAGSSIGLGFASILAGLGLLTIKKKREDDEK